MACAVAIADHGNTFIHHIVVAIMMIVICGLCSQIIEDYVHSIMVWPREMKLVPNADYAY